MGETSEGVSFDSMEFDIGAARFEIDGDAEDVCLYEEPREIGVRLMVQSALDEVHIVFDAFECDLYFDPFFDLHEEKLGDGKGDAGKVYYWIAGGMIIGLFIVIVIVNRWKNKVLAKEIKHSL